VRRSSYQPLAEYRLFSTDDLDEAREQVARVFCPHGLELLRGNRLEAFQNAAQLDDVCLSFLSYGGAVRITPGRLESFYLVQTPLSGGAEINAGSRSVVSTPSRASVLSPDDSVSMRWSAESPQLDVYLGRGALERRLEGLLGRPLREPLRFELGMELATVSGRGWLRVVSLVREELELHGLLLRQPLVAAQLEELLMTTLLLAQPHNYSDLLRSNPEPLSPRAFRRVLDHIHEHLHEPMPVGDVARVGGVSVRSLEQSFRRHLGITPSAYIRDLRLQRAHADLVAADPTGGVSVADIAATWGFMHLGRFSELHRRTFGVTPSQTLRS